MTKQELTTVVLLSLCYGTLIVWHDAGVQACFGMNAKAITSTRVIVVPDNFTRIQDAVDHASEGNIVLVKAGFYNESIVIQSSISLIGSGRDSTTLLGRPDNHVITISASNVTVRGFNIRNGESGSLRIHFGINIVNVDYAAVENNTITGNFIGIYLGNKNRGSHNNTIEGNIICGNRYGIFLAHSDENLICGNIISDSCWNGVELDWCYSNIIYGNVIYNSTKYGLEIPLETPGRNNLFFYNNFINNSYQARVWTNVNTWHREYPFGGNYWSDYEGLDYFSGENQTVEGSDGIGDTRYSIDENNKDAYPLAGPVFTFKTVRIDEKTSYIHVTSNSTVSEFSFKPEISPIIEFSVTAKQDVKWFCRITISKNLLWSENSWVTYVDNEAVQPYVLEDLETTYIFLAYAPNSTRKRTIQVIGTGAIPELSSFVAYISIVFSTSMAATFTVCSKRKQRAFKTCLEKDRYSR